MEFDQSNELFALAVELVNQTSRPIFLTGKAGTGKTTFLRYIREHCSKQLAVVAPTGVAAINAGGVTIHSFFQLPLMPYVPETDYFSAPLENAVDREGLFARLRMTGEKQALLRELELLIIDEISMVRCDTLDAVDQVLRHIRRRPHESFGGVQVLFIGDMFQLPPVVRPDTWNLLSRYYPSPYFFDSRVVKKDPPLYIEFEKIYRQNEASFIRVLNQVRNNELDEEGREILESRFQPGFERSPGDGYIVLTTHNQVVNEINTAELRKLKSPAGIYEAQIEGDFPENSYPSESTLELKTGAQVMFIRNDSDKARRFYNGKIGVVTKMEEGKIFVQCGDEPEIEVFRVSWDNIRYALNEKTRAMEEEVLGSFSQYPLRLAWAITIHKSQGLTFEKAIIDAGKAFAGGQVYVALSRCTDLKGLVLQSRINNAGIFTDARILQFANECRSSAQLRAELETSRRQYLEKQLLSAFDNRSEVQNAIDLRDFIKEHKRSFDEQDLAWMQVLVDKLDAVQATALKFQDWIGQQFKQPAGAEADQALRERAARARGYFIKEWDALIEYLQQCSVTTDSRTHSGEFNQQLKELYAGLWSARALMKQGGDELDTRSWQRTKTSLIPAFGFNSYAGVRQAVRIESPHPQLYQQLRKLRDEICNRSDLPVYMVASSKSLDEMSTFLPHSNDELLRITGFGVAKVEAYGEQFIRIIREYCDEKGLESRMQEKETGKKAKSDRSKKKPKEEGQGSATTSKKASLKETKPATKEESLALLKSGMSIAEIASTRNRAVSTIESHLLQYLQTGEITIEQVMDSNKVGVIEAAIRELNKGPLTPIKERLGDEYSFGEIRMVKASMGLDSPGQQQEADQ